MDIRFEGGPLDGATRQYDVGPGEHLTVSDLEVTQTDVDGMPTAVKLHIYMYQDAGDGVFRLGTHRVADQEETAAHIARFKERRDNTGG